MTLKIAVIGAGVIGISSVSCILESLHEGESFMFDLYADRFSPHTTSDIAAGLCYTHCLEDTPSALLGKWMGETIQHLKNIFDSESAAEAGVSIASGYIFTKDEETDEVADRCILERLLSWRMLDSESFPVKGTAYTGALEYVSTMAQCNKYIPWMCKRYLKGNVNFIEKRIEDISELYEQYDVVINCSGIGARHLMGDEELIPGRGQIIKVVAPWIRHGYMDCWTYVLPGIDYITVGGTYQLNDWNLDIVEEDKDDIWARCCRMMPSLMKANIVGEGVGLRPVRSQIKLDSNEFTLDNGNTVILINNYGHGMAGVTLSWGCGQQVASLFREAIEKIHNK